MGLVAAGVTTMPLRCCASAVISTAPASLFASPFSCSSCADFVASDFSSGPEAVFGLLQETITSAQMISDKLFMAIVLLSGAPVQPGRELLQRGHPGRLTQRR